MDYLFRFIFLFSALSLLFFLQTNRFLAVAGVNLNFLLVGFLILAFREEKNLMIIGLLGLLALSVLWFAPFWFWPIVFLGIVAIEPAII